MDLKLILASVTLSDGVTERGITKQHLVYLNGITQSLLNLLHQFRNCVMGSNNVLSSVTGNVMFNIFEFRFQITLLIVGVVGSQKSQTQM